MTICYEGDNVTIDGMRSLIGNVMRIIPHTQGTLVVDLKDDIFYVIKNTGKLDSNQRGLYEVVLIGKLDRLIELLVWRKLNVER